jgi:hypothetical protein
VRFPDIGRAAILGTLLGCGAPSQCGGDDLSAIAVPKDAVTVEVTRAVRNGQSLTVDVTVCSSPTGPSLELLGWDESTPWIREMALRDGEWIPNILEIGYGLDWRPFRPGDHLTAIGRNLNEDGVPVRFGVVYRTAGAPTWHEAWSTPIE